MLYGDLNGQAFQTRGDTCIVQLTHFSVQRRLTQGCQQLNPSRALLKSPRTAPRGERGMVWALCPPVVPANPQWPPHAS